MGLATFTSSRKYKKIMSMVYGIGASIVIIGALFKIIHLKHANELLILGLTTEAIIFFLSAFEPPHVEPDWSLVYPELGGIYHNDKNGRPIRRTVEHQSSVTEKLDDMLSKAKIGPELIESLGSGMQKMSENVNRMTDVTNAAVTHDDFIRNVKDAGKSAGELSQSYKKVSDVLNADASTVGEFSTSIKSAASSAGNLATVYNDVSAAIRNEMTVTETFSSSMASASESANRLADKYNKSAELLSKSAEMLNFSALDSQAYNDQLQKISANLAALNTIYEVQLKSSNDQIASTNQLRSTVNNFLESMNESSSNMLRYQQEMDQLTKRVSALNQVYGNMLSAMNVNMNK